MQPRISVIRAEGARYKMSFESDDGTISGKVNVALPAGDDQRCLMRNGRQPWRK